MKLPRRPQRHSPDPPPNSPYVGPQPFQKGHGKLFFGRDREIADIIALLSSRRAVLLHADSGAGKTSLLNAGLLSTAPPDEFVILPPARVRGRPADGRNQDAAGADQEPATNGNTYCHNYVEDLHAQIADSFPEHREALSRIQPGESLAAYADAVESVLLGENDRRTVVYIFDQFEELFTTNLTAWKERRGFFEQARRLLNPPAPDDDSRHKERTRRRLLLSMRSDFVAQVERFAHLLPERLNARYHLQRLKMRQAVEAIARPAAAAGRPFDKSAPEELARRLSEERVMTPDGKTEIIEGEFVEPVQLQVICERLWRSLPPGADHITKDLAEKYGDVEQGLTEYYELAVSDAVTETNVSEKLVRRWFDNKLITSGGFRSQAFVDVGNQMVDGLPLTTADRLESAYHIVRSEQRAGARWVEISHDRFVEPIRKSNQEFNRAKTQRLNNRIVAASLSALVLVAAILVYRQDQEQSRAETENFFSSAVIAALSTDSLANRTRAALDALAIRQDNQSIGAAYSVLADLGTIESILPLPFLASTSRSALAVDEAGQPLVGEWRDGGWRVGNARTNVASSLTLVSGYEALQRFPPSNLAWSRDGNRIAFVRDEGGSIVVAEAGGSVEPLNESGDLVRHLALDPTGRYLAVLYCATAAKSTCLSPLEIAIWDIDRRVRHAPPPPFAANDLRRVAVAWPQNAVEPIVAISGCASEYQADAQAAAPPSRSIQQTAPSPRESAAPSCSEHILMLYAPDTGRLGGQSADNNSDSERGHRWQYVNHQGQIGEMVFSMLRSPEPGLSPSFLFVERDRNNSVSAIRSATAGLESYVGSLDEPRVLVSTPGSIRSFVELDANRIAWIDTKEEGIVIADHGVGAALSTLLPGSAEMPGDDFDEEFVRASRVKFLSDTGEFLFMDGGVLTLHDRGGSTRALYQAERSSNALANVVVSGNERYAGVYGVFDATTDQDLVLVDLRARRILASNMDGPNDVDSTKWSSIVNLPEPAALAFVPGSQQLVAFSAEGELATWNLDTEPAPLTRAISLPEDIASWEIYDFYAFGSAPLAILAGEKGALAIDVENLTWIHLSREISIALAPLDNEHRIAIAGEDNVRIWQRDSILRTLRSAGVESIDPDSSLEPITAIVAELVVDPGVGRIYGALYGGAIQIWDSATGQKIGKPIRTGFDELVGIALDPVAQRILASHITLPSEVTLVDVSTPALQRALCQVIAGPRRSIDALPASCRASP